MSQTTGVKDEHYNLISVLYHALQGSETVGQYMQDAQGSEELTQFLQNTQQQYNQIAQQAKKLLGQQLSQA
ncbi:hypothetical protein [Truepera radiovictrix]|uniref:Spore coat protein n=1 Tax=Truepera radiovictrix (strain DSM 17093 / CIP 108686 / LMG 22925 / RQ-24) TaxID=649638 RepID=D7CU14_TRURR|nr:hypothetical protein [Truepera radiovictrix]ADI13912.1 conserved hypothetical protein [Truepera radiovictrix DSM 17093]WMT57523.1 hypothetical protein RCV51_00940 [Truepera radiovictrix]